MILLENVFRKAIACVAATCRNAADKGIPKTEVRCTPPLVLAACCSSAVLSRTEHEKLLETLFADIQVRAHVAGIKARLEAGLAALAAAAAGDAAFTSSHLEDVAPLAAPLLASPLVGEGAAWEAVRAMAAALPRGLNIAATSLATALRLVSLQAATGEAAHLSTPGFRIAANFDRFKGMQIFVQKMPFVCSIPGQQLPNLLVPLVFAADAVLVSWRRLPHAQGAGSAPGGAAVGRAAGRCDRRRAAAARPRLGVRLPRSSGTHAFPDSCKSQNRAKEEAEQKSSRKVKEMANPSKD